MLSLLVAEGSPGPRQRRLLTVALREVGVLCAVSVISKLGLHRKGNLPVQRGRSGRLGAMGFIERVRVPGAS